MDLLLDLPSGPRRIALERALRVAVTSGQLQPGSALPSTRQLAAELGMARGTVITAIEQLVVEGLLETRQGAATRVAHVPSTVTDAARPPAPPRPAADFVGGDPDLTLFPRSWWSAAVRRVLASAPADAFGYGDPQGRIELRTALVEYLGRTRGVVADPKRVVVTAGFAHALAILGRAIRDRRGVTRHDGTRGPVAVEDPSLQRHRDLLAGAGLEPIPVRVDEQGVDVDELAGTDAIAALLTPAHHLPLGVTLAPARRTAAVSWAARNDGVIVEDDYDGELRYDRQPVGALHTLDPHHIVYCGTASKAVAPGLRLGWCVVPPSLVEPVTDSLWVLGGSIVSTVEQLALADVLTSGRYDRHVRKIRTEYRSRRDLLVSAVAEMAPGVRVEGVAAGLVALLRLPDHVDEAAVVDRMLERSVAVDPLQGFVAGPSSGKHSPAIVVNYGQPYGHEYRAALDRLVRSLADVLGSLR